MNIIEVRRHPITPETRKFVLDRDNHACRYCGSKNSPFHLDHVYPVSKGGETTINNLVTSCETCNHAKFNKIGVYPKPIGYFDEVIDKHFLHFMMKAFVAIIVMFLWVISVTDFMAGLNYYGQIELYASAIVMMPLFLDRIIKDIRTLKESL